MISELIRDKIKIINENIVRMGSEIKNRLKPMSKERHKQIEKFAIYSIAVLIGILIIWFLFSPYIVDNTTSQSGFNVNIPQAVESEMIGDKHNAYAEELITKKNIERDEIKTLAENMIVEQAKNNDNKTKENVVASTVAYRDMNKTLGEFYNEPKVDTQKEQMQNEIKELKEQLSTQHKGQPSMDIDDQVHLMEKSYELAAKYMPSSNEARRNSNIDGATTPQIESAKEYVNGKAQINRVRKSTNNVVSTLDKPISDSAFIAEFSKNRQLAFNTAVGGEQKSERNTILAVIHSNQTIRDGACVKLRIEEDMLAADQLLLKNTVITGNCKIQGDRLNITINSLEYKGYILPVDLSVIDSDGQEGIYIPNSMERNAVKEIAANLGSNLGTTINLNNQSAGDQILTDLGKGAIQGVSQYIGKKIQEVKVHLKAGYKVMLYQKK